MADIPPPPWETPPDRHAGLWPPDRSDEGVDPDAPLITWRWQRPRGDQALRERTFTIDADVVMPSSLDRRPHDYVRSGQSYTRAFAVLALPRQLHPRTLGRIARLPGVHMALVNNPVPRQLAKERLANLARSMGVAIHQAGEERADDTLALRDLRAHERALAEERSAHHLYGLYWTVAGADLTEVNERSRAFLDACTDAQMLVTRCDLQHWDGVLTTTALGHDTLRYLNETDTQTLARLLPATPASLPGGQGLPIFYGLRGKHITGEHADGAIVTLDRFALPSPHKAVIGAIGGGKSYHEFAELFQRFAYGNCVIAVIDPKNQEYRRFLEEFLGGTYVVLSEQSPFRINPLTLPYGNPAALEHLRTLNTDIRAERAALVKQMVVDEAIARERVLSGKAEAELEEAILACYLQRGISHDPISFHAEVPTMSDVVAMLIARQADQALIDHLTLFTSGRLGRLINAPATIPLAIPPSRLRPDVGVLGFDLSPFVQGNDRTLQRIIPTVISNYLITAAMNGDGRPMELVVEEAWTILGTEAGAQLMERLGRTGRSLKIAVTAATQQIGEFLFRTANNSRVPNEGGKAFLNACETILLLRQLRPARAGQSADDNPILMAAEHFGLTAAEIDLLSNCRRDPNGKGATGLLIVGRRPIPLCMVPAPEPLHSWITQASSANKTGMGEADGT